MSQNWDIKKIEEVCVEIIDCINKTAPSIEGPTEYKMLRTTNVRDGWVDTQNVKYVDKKTYEKWIRRGKPRKGDVILTREAPLGEVGMLRNGDTVFLGQRLVMYRADPEKLDNQFLLYSMQDHFMQSQIKAYGSGSTVEHMRVPHCKELEINLPPLETQQKIASTLSAFDDLIENNTRRIGILEEMARLIYCEWFVHYRYPGHEKDELVDSGTEFGKVPEGWGIGAYDEFIDVLSGGTPRTRNNDYWDGDIPFFSPKDAVDYPFVLHTSKSITNDGLENCSSQLYEPYTVFITARGTVGRLNMPIVQMAMNQSCYALRAKKGLSQFFIYYSLMNQVKALQKKAHGAVFDTIIKDTFKQLKGVFPRTRIVNEFDTIITPILKQIEVLLNQNQNLKDTRDLLLPKLISGKLED